MEKAQGEREEGNNNMRHNTVKRMRPLIGYVFGKTALVHIGGRVIIMDAEDVHLLDGWTVSLTRGRVTLRGTSSEPHVFQTSLYRAVMGAPAGTDVDHISGDTLDNRKINLRICTHAENLRNCKSWSTSKSPFKGCYQRKCGGPKRWRARIQFDGKSIYIGCYLTAEEAAEAYNAKAVELHGQYARLNVIGRHKETVSVSAT